MAKRSRGVPRTNIPPRDVAAGGGTASRRGAGSSSRGSPAPSPRQFNPCGRLRHGKAPSQPRRSSSSMLEDSAHAHGGDAASPSGPAGCTTWDGPSLRNRGHRNRHHCSQGEPARRSSGTGHPPPRQGGTAGGGTAWQAGDAGVNARRGAAACVGQCGQGSPGGQRTASIGLRRQGTHR